MLHGVHFGLAARNSRGHARIGHRLGRDWDVHRLRQVNAAKHDAGVRLGRAQGQLNPLAAVQTHTHRTGDRFQSALLQHALAAPHQSACLRRNAGISKSSMPPEDSASTRAVACARLVRHTLGTVMLL